MLLDNVSRKQAFLTHLAVSSVIFLVMLYIIVMHWYPSFFLTLDGGVRGIATIFFVDVVLGPGLTLLVFKPGKPSLRFDMSVIILLQCLALAWGVGKVYEDRSSAAVFFLGQITCLGASSTTDVDPAISSGEYSRQKLAFLQRADSMDEYGAMLNKAMEAGASEIYFYGDRFVPVDKSNIARIKTYVFDDQQLQEDAPDVAALVEAYISDNPGYAETYGLYPLSCRFGDAIAVMDFDSLEVVNTLPIKLRQTTLRTQTTMPFR